ncbi:hypothetical protein GOP47_0017292 [Adiantum capillus-veneris]|uniref:Aquaporin n=1 Tax=Adiantum capillus-veneris TaxID=13818 RepID=A0A9D4UG56_ADICA|nr:hypothetical protein GOP47_0017292 [Adiantum capillus-veneris]
MTLLRKATAELVGTFVVVLASCAGSIAAAKEIGYTYAEHGGVAVGSGMAVMLMVWALAPISSAHLNPAVTLGFAAARLFPWREVGVYILSQTIGALLASLSLRVIVHEPTLFFVAINEPLNHPSASITMEFVATFILMLINMKVACNLGENGDLGGSFMIGSTVALLGYYGRPLCGGLSMNPARSLGPALVAMNFNYLYIFIIGPIVGAMLSGLTYTGIKPTKSESI